MKENVFRKLQELVVFSAFNIELDLKHNGFDFQSVSATNHSVTIDVAPSSYGYEEADNIASHFKAKGYTTQVINNYPLNYQCVVTK